MFLATTLSTNSETIGDLEYEINEEKFIGRGNLKMPQMVENLVPLSKKIGLVLEPIVALKRTIKLKPKEEKIVDLIISVGEEESAVKENLEKYKSIENVKTEIEISKARVEAESRYLRIKGKEIAIYQKILSYIIFDNSPKSITLSKNLQTSYRQSQLWKYGISGDLPIILVKIKDANDSYVIKEILKAHEFFRTKNVQTEVVILDEEKHSYENYVKEEIENDVLNSQMAYLRNIKGGIFTLSKGEIDEKDIKLLELISVIKIDTSKGGIENTVKEIEEEYLEKYKQIGEEDKPEVIEETDGDINILENTDKLKYYNEYGGFSEDGKEYLIKVNKKNRLPTVWSHIMANKTFGTIVTENMGGYTWYKNSRLNRVSSWENNPSYDIPSEIIYLKDDETKKAWSLGLNPMPDEKNYNIIYGFGYCKYIHRSDGIEQELEIFVPKEETCKINILTLKNTTPNRKKLKLYYYIKPVIGEDEIKSNQYITVNLDKNSNIVWAKNLYQTEELENLIYISTSEKIKSYTGDKNFFLGNEGLSNPQGLRKERLNNETGLGKKSCMVFEIEIQLESYAKKEITLILGADEKIINCKNTAYKYSKIQNARQELEICKNAWKELLRKTTGIYPIRINKYIIKWLDTISNFSK